jgi:tetratricopeptide (TPR) repeat protein
MPKAKREPGIQLDQIGPHEWVLKQARISEQDLSLLDLAIDLLGSDPAKAAAELRALLTRNPDDIDLRHHRAMALERLGQDEEAFGLWSSAVRLGVSALPRNFYFGCDRLEWGWSKNRPFLRAYHGLAAALVKQMMVGEAVAILNNILDLNPRDNQGVRMMLVGLYFGIRRPGNVLRVCEGYPDDGPELQFGRSLALHQLGEPDEADAAYREAAAAWPRVHEELLKTRHTRPKEMQPGDITMGSTGEAFAYWELYGEHWKDTHGALAMARRAEPGKEAGKRGRKLEAI